MKKIGIYIALLLMFACTDQEFVEPYGEGTGEGTEIPAGEYTLSLNLPEVSTIQLRSTSPKTDTEKLISNLYVVTCKSDGTVAEVIDISLSLQAPTEAEPNKRKITLKLIKPLASFHIVANVGSLSSSLEATRPDELFSNISASPFIMWGRCTDMMALQAGTAEIALMHNVAKTSVEVASSVTNFTLSQIELLNTSNVGSIAPKNYVTNTLTEQTSESHSTTQSKTSGLTDPFYFFETKKGNAKLIIRATYNGVTGYYSIAYINSADEELDLLRNHYYRVIISEVTGKGYPTRQEAIDGDPVNIRAQIVDYNTQIKNIIANGTYELGVCDTLYVDATSATGLNTYPYIVTNYQGTPNYVVVSKPDWITSVNENVVMSTTTPASGKLIGFEMAVDNNDKSDSPRTGKILFRSGNLERELYIIQKGSDLKRDDTNRLVTMMNGASIMSNNYWDFISATVQGTGEEDMDGIARDQGLHFSVMANTYSYKIKHKDGDVVTSTSSKFTVTETGGGTEWTVTLTSDAQIDEPWMESFEVQTVDGLTITYPVYRTGVLVEEDGNYQVNVDKKTGWFYYEMVKVGTSFWLDRNLGASSNSFYTYTTTSQEGQNINSIGGFYQIATSKTDQVNPCPDGFKVPGTKEYDAISGSFAIQARTTSSGEKYYRPEMATIAGFINPVVMPLGKYMDNDLLKGNSGGYYWTETKVSGTQGFDEGSPEYGFWYRYLSLVGENMSYSNARFVNGSSGVQRDVMKGMLIRCVRK